MGNGKGLYNALNRSGLLNESAGDIKDIAGEPERDLCGTWCTQSCATLAPNYLRIIHVGHTYKNHCPNCGTEHLYHDKISPIKASKLRHEAEEFLAREATRKGSK
jgi:hypothetical protein